jgi:hypothetical protein
VSTYTDNNRALVSGIFDALGSRALNQLGSDCPPIFAEASDAGLIALVSESSADHFETWDWEINIEDLLILAGPEWSTEAKREAHRMVDSMAVAVVQGHGQATDAEREAASSDNWIAANAG